MLELIDDIEKALKAEAYLSALALALTLPDICGQVAYPDIERVGERYIKWYDENITEHDFPPDMDARLKFDGKKCYKLRCALLHSGNTEGTSPDEFELSITRPIMWGVFGGSNFGRTDNDVSNKPYRIRLDIAQICFAIYSVAKGFYERYENKEDFNSHSIVVRDMDAEAEKYKRLNLNYRISCYN